MIEIKNVSFQYQNAEVETLKNINLNIKRGECILLCGESGSGKTAVTRLINGLIPHFYEGELKGAVHVDGLEVETAPLYETARKVGSVFQNPRSQFYCVDTTSEIAFGCENMGMPVGYIMERGEQVTKELEIKELLHRNIFELSGGEKQKIACASVSAFKPEVFVLDEPTSNLDVNAIETLKSTLFLWKKQGKTIVIAEHRLYWLTDICDRVIYMKDGEIQKEFSMNEFCQLSENLTRDMGLRTLDLSRITCKTTVFHSEKKMVLKNFQYAYEKKLVMNLGETHLPVGAVIAVIGHNGAGKSTFSKCLCGLQKGFSGSASIDGEVRKKRQLLKKSYLVMQDVNHQLFCESVLDEVELGMNKGNGECLYNTISVLGLTDYKERHPMSLSGGQKQRVAIASAILADKDTLVFDEPTSGLDYRHMEQTASLLSSLKGNQTVFIVTHDLELIAKCATHVLHIEDGKKKAFYPMDETGIEKVRNYFLENKEIKKEV